MRTRKEKKSRDDRAIELKQRQLTRALAKSSKMSLDDFIEYLLDVEDFGAREALIKQGLPIPASVKENPLFGKVQYEA